MIMAFKKDVPTWNECQNILQWILMVLSDQTSLPFIIFPSYSPRQPIECASDSPYTTWVLFLGFGIGLRFQHSLVALIELWGPIKICDLLAILSQMKWGSKKPVFNEREMKLIMKIRKRRNLHSIQGPCSDFFQDQFYSSPWFTNTTNL